MEQEQGLNQEVARRVALGVTLAGVALGALGASDRYVNHLESCSSSEAQVCAAPRLMRNELITLAVPSAIGAFAGAVVIARRKSL